MKKKILINRNKQNEQKALMGMSHEYLLQVNNRAMRRLKKKGIKK